MSIRLSFVVSAEFEDEAPLSDEAVKYYADKIRDTLDMNDCGQAEDFDVVPLRSCGIEAPRVFVPLCDICGIPLQEHLDQAKASGIESAIIYWTVRLADVASPAPQEKE